ncbi:heme exporter protein CcmD [Chitinibacter bivalviorum]|uniref:Heme exporter protein D n=1 Tax=Chitinibacter bivalviorum TaxID=2739434 RepID=A0A7H9BNM7_9NEIS|nr:heme exporter protein CcmD [Chitinibacter bivalviorum]
MYWQSWSQFFAMGGYGVYVWGSFFVCFLSLCIEGVLLRSARQSVLQQLCRTQMLQALKAKDGQS